MEMPDGDLIPVRQINPIAFAFSTKYQRKQIYEVKKNAKFILTKIVFFFTIRIPGTYVGLYAGNFESAKCGTG